MPTGDVRDTGKPQLSYETSPHLSREHHPAPTGSLPNANGTCDDGGVGRPLRRSDEDSGDAALVRRIRAGDRAAIDELYERFGRPAFALAHRILADEMQAEDVLQDVFVTVWRDPGAFDRSRGSVGSWLLAMVHHKAVDVVRREESHRRRKARAEDLARSVPTAAHGIAGDVFPRVTGERVRAALGGLPGLQREALALAYYGGYTQREVASLTGAPLGTIKTRMLAAVRRLREELGEPAGGRSVGGVAPVDGPGR
jgi:RNA polymerase sigma-70 factor (ECF subfamily)